MHIEELLIEGFKSYVSRTQITNWDPQFNAITGLNGTGKSNILDAICFVLGITNLSQVRASNLQDLIYKRGTAGVTKASVTIVFNNENTAKSPVGFEASKQITITRQVLMGGRTKYIVNGRNTQQQTVQTLLQSVQLNVNNPHFLIMQGRITKVLNMRPAEVLSMVEEAAGTKMYEDRKKKALATLKKEETKVQELDALLKEEIEPKLNRLREERRVFLDFQKNEVEMEKMNRYVISYQYATHQNRLNSSDADNQKRLENMQECENTINNTETEIQEIEKARQELLERIKEDSDGGKKIKNLESQSKEYSTQIVRLTTKKELAQSSITDEQKKLTLLSTQKGKAGQTLNDKKQAFEKIENEYEQFNVSYNEKEEQLKNTEELIQTLTTGISAEEGRENGYAEQLKQSKSAEWQASTAEDQASLKIEYFRRELSEKEPQIAKELANSQKFVSELEEKKSAVNKLEEQLAVLNWDPTTEEDLLARETKEKSILKDLKDRKYTLARKLNGLEFQYKDPTPNFNRAQVMGAVAELIQLKEDKQYASKALEICAGGKLYSVVVENEVVGRQILESGLTRRRTLIPLNKIHSNCISNQAVALAKKLAPGKVDLALNLIDYPKHLEKTMEWIFGSTFICEDAETASKITFHDKIWARSVTLDGDVYDPRGTLAGGSDADDSGILIKVQELKSVDKDIEYHTKLLEQIESELKACQKTIADYNYCKQRLELQNHEIGLLEKRMGNSIYAELTARVQELKTLIAEQEEAKKQATLSKKKAQQESKRIENESADFRNNKDKKLDELMLVVKRLKKEIGKDSSKSKNMERSVQMLTSEIEQLQSNIDEYNKNIDKTRNLIEEYKENIAVIEKELEEIDTDLVNINAELANERATLQAQNKESKELGKLFESKQKELASLQSKFKKLAHENERVQKERSESLQVVKDLERLHPWIEDEKEFFGEEGSAYDHEKMSLVTAKDQLKTLVTKHDTLRKKVNGRVMNMIDNVEKREETLKEMLITIKADRQKIEDTLIALDGYKMEALEKTFHKVNEDFSGIFGDLLHGNTCKLQVPEGGSLSDGLEIKVCLGGVWKESLTELSGGQRSLVALSLILAFLQFKPAPMYILDEVDAALDMSHTENIGSLLRTRFRGSQFIVVSLKDDMFSNANVLFTTRFRNGTSVVERTTPNHVESTEDASRKRVRN